MQSDNKVSSFLLLILIGLGIYLLLNRGEGFKSLTDENFNSVYPSEPFEDVSKQPIINSDYNINTSQPSISQQYIPSTSQHSTSQPSTSQHSTSQHSTSQHSTSQPSTSQHSTSQPSTSQHSTSQPSTSQYMPSDSQQYMPSDNQQYMPSDSQQYVPSTSSNPPSSASIFDFEPNDESIFDNHGSTLTDAFAPPIPTGTNTESVNFKKQNMENYNAKDFLPHEINDEWFETDFSLAKYQLNDDKLINTERYIIGINTVGQSLKNASYDIRGTIPNPKFVISPWNNSTYEADFNLKPLC